jgi:hypothetical protein
MKYVFAGDSWASKGFTEQNYQAVGQFDKTDVHLPSFWNMPYQRCIAGGQGNLACLDRLVAMQLPEHVPIIWVYTEPGRDYARITGNPEHEWMQREDLFELRNELNSVIIKSIRHTLPNPIAFIGGLSDVPTIPSDCKLHVLHPSWQHWIATTLNSQWFKLGWGAADIGWRMHSNNIVPGKAATFAWDEQIKEWCWWEESGYFCHEHPSPRANKEFAEYLQPKVEQWLKNQTS